MEQIVCVDFNWLPHFSIVFCQMLIWYENVSIYGLEVMTDSFSSKYPCNCTAVLAQYLSGICLLVSIGFLHFVGWRQREDWKNVFCFILREKGVGAVLSQQWAGPYYLYHSLVHGHQRKNNLKTSFILVKNNPRAIEVLWTLILRACMFTQTSTTIKYPFRTVLQQPPYCVTKDLDKISPLSIILFCFIVRYRNVEQNIEIRISLGIFAHLMSLFNTGGQLMDGVISRLLINVRQTGVKRNSSSLMTHPVTLYLNRTNQS